MVVIRLARGGYKKNPFYHVVVTDRRNSRDGRFIENLGYFDPMARGKATQLTLEKDRIQHWISKGAQPSPRVQKLLKDFEKSPNQEPTPNKAKLRIAQAQESIKAHQKAKAEASKKPEERSKSEQTQGEEKQVEQESK